MAKGKFRALVLGASAENGTGWSIAQLLAKEGASLAVGARSQDGIAKLASQINAYAIRCDCTIEAEVAAMADAAVISCGGNLDAAVLVAGDGVLGTVDAISEAELQRATSLNYTAAVYFVRHMARRMNDHGSIVLMSSVVATRPWPGYFAYACAKSAVQTLVEYAALEYAPRGIRINAVIPSPIQTPAALKFLSVPQVQKALYREIPLGRAVLPSEVAEAVVWLATRAASITGVSLFVDGGMHLRRPPFPDELQGGA